MTSGTKKKKKKKKLFPPSHFPTSVLQIHYPLDNIKFMSMEPMHIHSHVYIHACMPQSYKYTISIHTHKLMHPQTCTHSNMHKHKPTYMCYQREACTHTSIRKHACSWTQAHKMLTKWLKLRNKGKNNKGNASNVQRSPKSSHKLKFWESNTTE